MNGKSAAAHLHNDNLHIELTTYMVCRNRHQALYVLGKHYAGSPNPLKKAQDIITRAEAEPTHSTKESNPEHEALKTAHLLAQKLKEYLAEQDHDGQQIVSLCTDMIIAEKQRLFRQHEDTLPPG